MENITHEEYQYLNLVDDIITKGYKETGRNGDTLVKFGVNMRFSLRNGKIPIITTKKMAYRTCFEELFWFIRGSTNNEELLQKNVKIWSANGTREFLDGRGLHNYKVNELGPIYGYQWRHFNAPYCGVDGDYNKKGIDQLQDIINALKNPETRHSRRHILTAWNPQQIDEMALPPCHVLAQFHVRENKYLSCSLYQRSGDVGLGVPFNISSYAMFTHILAKHCGLEPDEFVHFIGNAHIYEEHIDMLKLQSLRQPYEFPEICIVNKHENINDYSYQDITWTKKYIHHDAIKLEMKA